MSIVWRLYCQSLAGRFWHVGNENEIIGIEASDTTELDRPGCWTPFTRRSCRSCQNPGFFRRYSQGMSHKVSLMVGCSPEERSGTFGSPTISQCIVVRIWFNGSSRTSLRDWRHRGSTRGSLWIRGGLSIETEWQVEVWGSSKCMGEVGGAKSGE